MGIPLSHTHNFPVSLGITRISLGKFTSSFFTNLARTKTTARAVKKTDQKMPTQKKKKEDKKEEKEQEEEQKEVSLIN